GGSRKMKRAPVGKARASGSAKQNQQHLHTPIGAAAQAVHRADAINDQIARACLAPEAIPGTACGVSWLISRDPATRLLKLRAISAFELSVAPFPEPRGTA